MNKNIKKTESILDILRSEQKKQEKIEQRRKTQDFFVYPLVLLTLLCLTSFKGIIFIIFFLPIILFLFYKDRLPSIKKLHHDGSLTFIKTTIIFAVVFTVLAFTYSSFKTLFFESTSDGSYAVSLKCVEYDARCLEYCRDTQYDNFGRGSGCDCCIKSEIVKMPISTRILELWKEYALYAIGTSPVFAILYLEAKK